MAEGANGLQEDQPNILFTAPTFRYEGEPSRSIGQPGADDEHKVPQDLHLRKRLSKHVQIEEPESFELPSASNIYLGSYGRGSRASQTSLDRSSHGTSPRNSILPSPRESLSHVQLEPLLEGVDVETDTYGLEELRDGFFDASFYRPAQRDSEEMRSLAYKTLPAAFRQLTPSSWSQYMLQQRRDLTNFLITISTTRSSIKLAKSFLGVFVAYVICLVPSSRDWLGRYNYILVISAIVNHPGRTIGAQVDGALLTIGGAAAGLAWGSLALYVSTCTAAARSGYGGILATFLILFTITIGWLRCVFMRFYQAVICAGIAIFYTCLAETSEAVSWQKIFDFGIPWVLGQAISLVVCILFLPAAGTRPLAISFQTSLQVMLKALQLPHRISDFLRRDLAWNFVNLSQATRDFTIDLTISPFDPHDVRSVRNSMQGVIRGMLAIRPDTTLFLDFGRESPASLRCSSDATNVVKTNDRPSQTGLRPSNRVTSDAVRLISNTLGVPTRVLIDTMTEGVKRVEAVLMEISGHRKYLGPPVSVSTDLLQILDRLSSLMSSFDKALESLVGRPEIPPTYSDHPEIIELFLFVHPVRQAADKIYELLGKVSYMQRSHTKWKINLPSYPFVKSLMRSNAQVRHDRGGLTAGFFFRSQDQLNKTMQDLQTRDLARAHRGLESRDEQLPRSDDPGKEGKLISKNSERSPRSTMLRHKVWSVLHRLQQFESRFAFKVTIVATLLAIPAWLPQSRDWWNENESWWVVVTVWIMMHPRVSGNFRDLTIRTLCVVLGSIWGGFAYAAGNGDPYVMAVFATIFMIPMLYRFTQSSHPRSGFIGCISFTVVSLNAYTIGGTSSILKIAWTRGIAFVVGVVSGILVNWILWPFIARNELRLSISTMMLHSAILYRGVVSRYVYYKEGNEPGPEDITRSEMLEGRLREGFVRIRQLMELTRHEVRIRAPFDPLPYSALINACEHLFEHLVEVRQSSLYFQPHMLAGNEKASEALFSPRRDAVAAVLMNLYVLAGALRSNRPTPRYLPSAAIARRRLLDKMEQFEAEQAEKLAMSDSPKGLRWGDVYHYAYSSALTDIVEQLQNLQYYTKEITGEVGFDLEEQT